MATPFIHKLINLHERFQLNRSSPSRKNNTATAIFGTLGTLQQSIQSQETYRIAIWPCVSVEQPAVGVGVMSLFSYLLDSQNDVRTYMLFVREDATEAAFDWSQAQFGIEDWQPSQLNENVAVAATLNPQENGYVWALEVENDLVADDHPDATFTLTYTVANLAELCNQLPSIAAGLLTRLGLDDNRPVSTRFNAYTPTQAADSSIIPLLTALGNWQIHLTRSLLGLEQEQSTLENDINALTQSGKNLQDSFGAWAASTAIAHALLPGYALNQALAPYLADAIETLNGFAFAATYIGNALFLLGETDSAYDILENAVNDHPQSVIAWLALADVYRRGAKLTEMIDAFQRAIEVDAVDATLYRNYGAVLEMLNDNTLLPEVILIDPTEYDDMLPTWEAIAAYDEALKLQPDSLNALQRRTLLLLDVIDFEEDKFLESFRDLVTQDATGDYLRSVLEQIGVLDDFDPVLDILEEAVEKEPNRLDLRINLAITYLASEDYDMAIEELEHIQPLTDDAALQTDITRLLLSANNPDFEARIAEIETQVQAGAVIGRGDIQFLENVIDQAPTLAEAYTLLGKAFLGRGEATEALETLMKGYVQQPKDSELLLQLGRVLWESGKETDAMNYLHQGVTANPNYVPLLALVGQYLFEDGQDEEARAYLSRAEAISPRDRALADARKQIANMIAGRE